MSLRMSAWGHKQKSGCKPRLSRSPREAGDYAKTRSSGVHAAFDSTPIALLLSVRVLLLRASSRPALLRSDSCGDGSPRSANQRAQLLDRVAPPRGSLADMSENNSSDIRAVATLVDPQLQEVANPIEGASQVTSAEYKQKPLHFGPFFVWLY